MDSLFQSVESAALDAAISHGKFLEKQIEGIRKNFERLHRENRDLRDRMRDIKEISKSRPMDMPNDCDMAAPRPEDHECEAEAPDPRKFG